MKRLFSLIALIFIFGCSLSDKADNTKFNLGPNEGSSDVNSIDFSKEYTLNSPSYNSQTKVSFRRDKRIMESNALPNHSTGNFPNQGNPNKISAQNMKYEFPLNPIWTGKAKWAREPGVAINGVKFEPGTAERFICESGEEYRIEAFQELVDLGLDHNNAHVQPTGHYHYHGIPHGLIEQFKDSNDLILIGFAHDGYLIYYSKTAKYKASYRLSDESRTGNACSYTSPHKHLELEIAESSPDGTFVSDWVYQKGLGDLDECNGIEIDGVYCYIVTSEYPYIGRCLKGKFEEIHPAHPRGRHHHGRKHHHHP
jgi:hypothetical protein